MKDNKVLVSEKLLRKAADQLVSLKVRYQSKSGQSGTYERGLHWLSKAQEVDDVITAIYMALEEAEEA